MSRACPLIVVVPADGAKSIGELAEMLRKEKGKYSYPSSGNGCMIHLAGYLFTEKVGGEALHVPYRGSAPGMVDLYCRPPRLPDGHARHQQGLH